LAARGDIMTDVIQGSRIAQIYQEAVRRDQLRKPV
jgi:hypothetical protein